MSKPANGGVSAWKPDSSVGLVSGPWYKNGNVLLVPSPLACEPVKMTSPPVVPRTPVTISPFPKIAEIVTVPVAS